MMLFFSIENKNNYFYLATDNEDERSYQKVGSRARANIAQGCVSINITEKSIKTSWGLMLQQWICDNTTLQLVDGM